MAAEADINGDGLIDFTEFARLMKNSLEWEKKILISYCEYVTTLIFGECMFK